VRRTKNTIFSFFKVRRFLLDVSAIYMRARNAAGAERFCSPKRFVLQLYWKNSLEETAWHKIEYSDFFTVNIKTHEDTRLLIINNKSHYNVTLCCRFVYW